MCAGSYDTKFAIYCSCNLETKDRTGFNKPLAGWRVGAEREGEEIGENDRTGERGGWDEVLDAKHGAEGVEGLSDALGLDFILYLQPHCRDIHQSIIRGSAQQVGVL